MAQKTDEAVNWQERISNDRLVQIWETATGIAGTNNGVDRRYLNNAIQNGGLEFSDVAETAWIFGFVDLADANDFFREFSHPKPH